MSFLSCPICSSVDNEMILSLDCGNLDGSKLYPTVRLMICMNCGHAFNDVTPEEILGLNDYYNYEYAPANLNSVVKEGDLPGSTGKYTHNRYAQLYQALSPHTTCHGSILDVGCAVGGFLDFLKEKGFSSLYGVDMTEAYVEKARNKKYCIELGCAENLPYDNNKFDTLVIEQVLEHLVNPVAAFREAGRVLKQGGILCIGVPDAARYNEFYYYDYYWILMREHIQHFDINSLNRLAIVSGFKLLDYQQTSHPIMGEKMVMPNLCATFRYTGQSGTEGETRITSLMPELMKRYVALETMRLSDKQNRIRSIAESCRSVYAWGIGREFLYLYETAGLKNCNLAGIIDMNLFKQRTATVNNINISSPDILKKAENDSLLIISAIAHEESIKKSLKDYKFMGELFHLS